MDGVDESQNTSGETLIVRIRNRAHHLYESRQMLCAEAVLTALNQGLGGGLTDGQTTALAAPFGMALGTGRCLCGALGGAVMAAGLLLGGEHTHWQRRRMRASARQLHDAFTAANGATCCRVLTRKVKHDSKAHFRLCAGLTAHSAELAARLVLQERPALIARADHAYPPGHHTTIGGALSRVINTLVR